MSDDYLGLFNPPGSYGLVSLGSTKAVTLQGSDLFRQRAINLFANFGGESNRGAWLDTRILVVHSGAKPNTCFFCLPTQRIHSALRLYLFGQLFGAAPKVDAIDEEGDFVGVECPTEDALMQEASQLATTFMAEHMPADYSILPESYEVSKTEEYALGLVDTNDYS